MNNKIDRRAANFNMILAFIIGLLIASAAWYFAIKPSKEVTVIPEVVGTLPSVKPINKTIRDTMYLTKFVNSKMDKKEKEFLQGEIDRLGREYDLMDEAFANANDSLQQLLYKDAITVNEFRTDFDNDTLSATAYGLVRGEVQTLGLKYKIKSKEIPKLKESVFRLLAGAEFGTTKSFDKVNAKGSLIGQFKSGNQISIGIDTEQRFYVGGAMSIFNVKK